MAGLFILDVSFNDTSLRDEFGIELLSYTIQPASTRKTRGVDIPGRDGIYKVNSAYSAKQIELSVVVEAATPKEVHKKIRTFLSWLSQQDEPKVIFTDNPDVFVKADLDSADDYYVTRGTDNAVTQLGIKLYQYDPFQYDNGVISYSFECTPGKVYDIINSGIYVPYVIYLSGTESALTEYLATGLGTNNLDSEPIASNIVIDVNGTQQLYQGTIGYEDVLEINGRDLTVLKNGESVIADWQGDIDDFIYGTNTFSMNNTEGISLFVTIEFYRRWL